MKVVLQTPTQLVVHEGVLKTVVLGAIFAAAGGGVITLRLADPTNWSGNAGPWLIYLVGGAFLALGITALALSADRRIVIDRAARTVRLIVQRLLHRTAEEYPLGDLQDVALERSASASRQPGAYYRIVFLTKTGGRVPWTPYSTTDEGTLASCASAVRAFCGWTGAGGTVPAAAPAAGRVSGHPAATSWGFLALVLGLFGAVGLGLFGSELYRVTTWQPVQARVLSTDIRAVRGNKGTSYAPVVRYQYAFAGGRYVADGVLPLSISASFTWAEKLRARFRPGEIVTAYVNPHRPSSAFLVRQVSLLPLLFVALPLAVTALLAWIARVQRAQLAAVEKCPVPVVESAP